VCIYCFNYLCIDCFLLRSFEERTTVHFADNSTRKLQAYVNSGEGVDRAGGFAIQVSDASLSWIVLFILLYQGLGGLLISKVEGDYSNVVGFPACAFFNFLDILVDEDVDFLAI
jgi:septum formation protein